MNFVQTKCYKSPLIFGELCANLGIQTAQQSKGIQSVRLFIHRSQNVPHKFQSGGGSQTVVNFTGRLSGLYPLATCVLTLLTLQPGRNRLSKYLACLVAHV